ncbi:Serine/threonine-protein kinase Doa, partial [Pseudolycoriella hygida]
ENVCYENSERESECETEYECIQTDNEYEDSGSDDDEYHDAKKSKLSEELLIDENGHIQWHPGQVIDNFEVRGVLGEGTFGRVLRVQNIKDGREAALKVIKSEANTRKSAMTEVIVLTMIEQRDRTETSFCIKMLSWFLYDGHACIAFPLLDSEAHQQLFSVIEKLLQFKPDRRITSNSAVLREFNEGTTKTKRINV